MNNSTSIQPNSQISFNLLSNKILALLVSVGIITFSIGIVSGKYIADSSKNKEKTSSSISTSSFQNTSSQTSNQSCQYYGKTYQDGDTFKDIENCNTCSCKNGSVMCTMMACLSSSSISNTQSTTATSTKQTVTKQELCTSNGGNWLSQYNECEGLDQNICTSNGGVFTSCASACRHIAGEPQCIEVCIKVCKF